jgi:hypothetical protein
MGDWYVGQKIVCINVDPIDGGAIEPEVTKHLKVGEVYVIRQILDFPYVHKGQKDVRLGFRLAGIKCVTKVTNECQFLEYAFWCGRFKPLEEDTMEVDVPEQMKDWLKDVVDGKVVFEEEKELEKAE